MPITFRCEKCKTSLTVPNAFAGRTGRCPKCGAKATAPITPLGGPLPLVWVAAAIYDFESVQGTPAAQTATRLTPPGIPVAVPVSAADLSAISNGSPTALAPGGVIPISPTPLATPAPTNLAAGGTAIPLTVPAGSPGASLPPKSRKPTETWGSKVPPPLIPASPTSSPSSATGRLKKSASASNPLQDPVPVESPKDSGELPILQDLQDLQDRDEESADSVTAEVVGPRLTVVSEGRTQGIVFPMGDSRCVVLGRDPNNEVAIPSGAISRQHCQIERKGDEFIITDLGSANGTLVNSEHTISALVKDGDYIQVGDVLLLFNTD